MRVANKLSELLMLRENHEVCCTEDHAGCQLQRWTEQLETEAAAQRAVRVDHNPVGAAKISTCGEVC